MTAEYDALRAGWTEVGKRDEFKGTDESSINSGVFVGLVQLFTLGGFQDKT